MQVLLFLVSMVFVNCKAHQGTGKEPHSDPDWATSNDGNIMLVVSLASPPQPSASDPKPSTKPRYCVSQISKEPSAVELLTDGGLDDMQLKSALRFMGLPSHLISGTLLIVGAVTSAVILESKGVSTQISGAFTPVGMVIVGLTVAGSIAYRIIKGNQEGEGKAAITFQSLMAGPFVTGPFAEAGHRNYRFYLITSDEHVLKLSDKKMKKVIERIKSKKPKYKGNCPEVVSLKLPSNR